MKISNAKRCIAASVVGVTALVVACIPCCISLGAFIVAWSGVTSLGAFAMGWHLAAIGVFALSAGTMMFRRFRRGASCQARQENNSCACGRSCGV